MATTAQPVFHVRPWGVRGSLPAPPTPAALKARIKDALGRFLEAGHREAGEIEAFVAGLPAPQAGGYGGNTPCVEVSDGQDRIVVDAGSGLRLLGYEMLQGPCGKGQGEVHVFLTHFHWDHLIGLPFFIPMFIPGNRVHLYAVQPELPEVPRTLFRRPFFPVALESLGAKVECHVLEPRRPVSAAGFTVTPYQLDHPDPCWGYRIERNGKAYAHCLDTECTRMSREALGPDLPLYQDADLMLFDAQYTLIETVEKVHWGHAAALVGIDLAMREGIRRVVFMHHDPAAPDEKIAKAEAQSRRYYQSQLRVVQQTGLPLHEVDWRYAEEGAVYDVG